MATPPRHRNRIKRLREAQENMSRAELASRLESTYGDNAGEPISERTIARWESTGRIPADRAIELAAIFGVSMDHLLGIDHVPGDGNGDGERAAA